MASDEDRTKSKIDHNFNTTDILYVNIKDKATKRLPGVAIVGAKKCGTIALAQMIRMHPKMKGPANTETWVWNYPKQFKNELEHYRVKHFTRLHFSFQIR